MHARNIFTWGSLLANACICASSIHTTLGRLNWCGANFLPEKDASEALSPPLQLKVAQSRAHLLFSLPVMTPSRGTPAPKRRNGRRTPSPNTTHGATKRNDPPEKPTPLTGTRQKNDCAGIVRGVARYQKNTHE